MSVFAYKGRDARGRTVGGHVEAASAKEARAALHARGILAEKVFRPSFDGAFDDALRAKFYEDVGMLLKSGFTIGDALAVLAEENSGKAAGALLEIRSRVMDGETLSGAVAAIVPHLPSFEGATLRAGEESGAQGDLLVKLAEFINADRGVRDRMRTALFYPGVVIAMTTLLIVVLVTVVLPAGAAMFPEGEAPSLLRLLPQILPAAIGIVLAVALALAAASLFGAKSAAKTGAAAFRRDRLLLSIPLVRRAMALLWASRFSGTMALFLKAGFTPQSAIAPAGEATGSESVASLAAEAAKDVADGLSLSQAVASMGPLAPILSAWFGIGERTGSLDDALDKAAQRTRSEYERLVLRAVGILEPALIGFAGLIVLLVALGVVKPILELTTKGLG